MDEQRQEQGKVLFSVTEMANVSGASRNAVNVEMSRLMAQGLVVRYAHGLYGAPGGVSLEALVSCIDDGAYITGLYALSHHNLVTQAASAITCFTNRYSPRGRDRLTPLGRLVFVRIRGRIYNPPRNDRMAGPEQALCDFVYMSRRRGIQATSQATFQHLDSISENELDRILERYPGTVRAEVNLLRQRQPI